MNVIGVSELGGGVAFIEELDQGADPSTVAFDQGYVALRPIDAHRNPSNGAIDLRFFVRPRSGEERPVEQGPRQDAGLDLTTSPEPQVRQRIAAYALVRSARGLLATQFSDRTAVAGRWGLPGGGVDEGEEPADAVLREVAEETQQAVTLGALLTVQTSHWIGRSPNDTIEDFHAVRLVYASSCDHPSRPVVVDVGGTTASARWVSLNRWQTLAWTVGFRRILTECLD